MKLIILGKMSNTLPCLWGKEKMATILLLMKKFDLNEGDVSV